MPPQSATWRLRGREAAWVLRGQPEGSRQRARAVGRERTASSGLEAVSSAVLCQSWSDRG